MKLPDDWFQQIKAAYPKRQGSQGWYGKPFIAMIERRLAEGFSFEEMLKGAKAYKAHADHTQITGTSFVMQAKRFFGPSLYFMELDSYEIPGVNREYRTYQDHQPTREEQAENQRKFEEQMKRYGVKINE